MFHILAPSGKPTPSHPLLYSTLTYRPPDDTIIPYVIPPAPKPSLPILLPTRNSKFRPEKEALDYEFRLNPAVVVDDDISLGKGKHSICKVKIEKFRHNTISRQGEMRPPKA